MSEERTGARWCDASDEEPYPRRSSRGLAWRAYFAVILPGLAGVAVAMGLGTRWPVAAALAVQCFFLVAYIFAAFILHHYFQRATNVPLGALFRPLTAYDGVVVLAAVTALAAFTAAFKLVLGGRAFHLPTALGTSHAAIDPYLLLTLTVSLIASPWVEEVLFRGLVFNYQKRLGTLRGAVFNSACIFAIAHGFGPGIVPLIAAGVAFAIVYQRTGNLATSVLAHCAYNALTTLVL